MKYQSSAIAATSMSGKSGGTVATTTNIFRRKSNPRNKRTSAQQNARMTITYLASLWGSLTEDQQNSWITAAPNHVRLKNGEIKKESGFDFFIRINGVLANFGYEVLLEYVSPVAQPDFYGPTNISGQINIPGPPMELGIQKQYNWYQAPTDNWKAAFLWTGWIKPSRHSFPAATRKAPVPEPGNYFAGWALYFGEFSQYLEPPPGEGFKAQVLERYVNITTGQILIADQITFTASGFDNTVEEFGLGLFGPNAVTEVDGDDVYLTMTFTPYEGTFDLVNNTPIIKWSGWGPGEGDIVYPLTETVPNTAIELVGPTELKIKWGPDAGMGPAPEVGQGGSVSLGFIQNGTSKMFAFGPYGMLAEP